MSGNALVADHGRRPAIITAREMRTCNAHGMLESLDPASPNATIIAAAPDMVEALRECVATLRRFCPEGTAYKLACDALAKAEPEPEPESQL